MALCPHHPQQSAEAQCEYCGEYFCEECLAPLMGRQYCPACREKVQHQAAGPAQVGSQRQGRPASTGPALPAWASVIVYAFAALMIMGMAQFLFALPLVVMKFAFGVFTLKQLVEAPEDVFGDLIALVTAPQGMPLPAYVVGMCLETWGMLLAVVLITYVFVRFLDRRPWSTFGLPWNPVIARELVLGVLLGGLFMGSIYAVGRFAGWYAPMGVAAPSTAILTVLSAFVILLPAAAAEEIIFRGYILQRLEQRHGVAWGLGVSSLLFGLVHLGNPNALTSPWPFLGILLAGVYLGAAYLITRNLWLAIFLHMAWNLFEGPVFGFPVSGIMVETSVLKTEAVGPVLWTGGDFGPEAGLLMFALMIVHLGLLLVIGRWLRPQQEAPKEAGNAA